jgi:hypothetical protein
MLQLEVFVFCPPLRLKSIRPVDAGIKTSSHLLRHGISVRPGIESAAIAAIYLVLLAPQLLIWFLMLVSFASSSCVQ